MKCIRDSGLKFCIPYVFLMLSRSVIIPETDPKLLPTSMADLPLSSVVGLYFCWLVWQTENTLADDGMDRQFANATPSAACTILDENLAIMPRLLNDKALTEEESDTLRWLTDKMKEWAHACTEPMSLGQISLYGRIYRADWRGWVMATNSVSLQVFLYLCEKRRLERSFQGTTSAAGDADANDYERLLGALMQDARVAPALLWQGRPTNVSQCIEALRQWCFIVTKDGETQEMPDSLTETEYPNQALLSRTLNVRKLPLLSREIAESGYGFDKSMRIRVSKERGKRDDKADDALRRYLLWELSPPDCSKLEDALFGALQKLPQTLLSTLESLL
jgi:hypothetical protein